MTTKLNGNLKLAAILLSIVLAGAAWGVTWGCLSRDVQTNTNVIQELKSDKADMDLINEKFRRIDEKLDEIIQKIK